METEIYSGYTVLRMQNKIYTVYIKNADRAKNYADYFINLDWRIQVGICSVDIKYVD